MARLPRRPGRLGHSNSSSRVGLVGLSPHNLILHLFLLAQDGNLEWQITLAAVTRHAKCLQVVEFRFSAGARRVNVIDHEDHTRIQRWTGATQLALEVVATHDDEPHSPRHWS